MGLAARKNYRKFLYINTLLIVLLGAFVAGGILFLLFPADLGQGYHSSLAVVRALRKVLFWKVAVVYAFVSLLIIVSIGVLHLFYSHRIAGPAYRLGLEAGKIARGDLTGTIKFRHLDNLTDIKDFLNDLARQYQNRIGTIKDCLAAVEMQSQTVSDIVRRGGDGIELRQAAEKIANNVRKIEQCLGELKT